MRTYARGRNLPGHTPGVMNRDERLYAEILEGQKLAGEIIEWKFEPIKFKVSHTSTTIGNKTRHSPSWWAPDFLVLCFDQVVELVDVKGTRPDEQAQRRLIRIVAESHPWFRFVVARRIKRSEGGGFQREEIEPILS